MIRDGDVLTFVGKALFSRMIQWWSGSSISHIGIAYYLPINGTKILCSLEAMEGRGVRIIPLHLVWGEYSEICYQTHDLPTRPVLERMINLLNDRYASRKQFLVIASRLWRYIRTKIGLPVDTSRSRWHCAEAVAYCLDLPTKKPYPLLTPAEVSSNSILSKPIRVSLTELVIHH